MIDPGRDGTAAAGKRGVRLRVGTLTVHLPSREVGAGEGSLPNRVTPKALAVLEALADRQGEVVARETLLSAAWPDTAPTDDVLTQAITHLRRVFQEQGGSSRYIETIAKTGYRLVVPVEWLHDAPSPAPASRTGEIDAGRPARAHSRRWVWIAAAVAIVAAASGWALLHGHRTTTHPGFAAAAAPWLLLTSSPGFELGPSLSPDASFVAYSATRPDVRGTAIMLQATEHALPRQLTFPPENVSDRLPAWSPDGRDIAYARDVGGDCQIRIVAADGGADRAVASCHSDDLLSFSWAPDGSALVFGSMVGDDGMMGIRLLDLATGRWQGLDYGRGGGDLDHIPRYSPDGRSIVFVRNPQRGDLWRIPVGGGDPERLTRESGEIRGWDWMADGSIVFSRRVGSGTRLFRLAGDGSPAEDLGIVDAQNPDVARGGAMAFERRQSRFSIFRFASGESSGQHGEPPQVLFPSSGRDTQPSLSPDGEQLVFTSDRSGHYALWWAQPDEPDSLRIFEGFNPLADSYPQWSWDSRRVLLAGDTGDGAPPGLHEVDVRTGAVKRLGVPGTVTGAAYAGTDHRLLVVTESEDARPRLALLVHDGGDWLETASIENVSAIRIDRSAPRVMFTRADRMGLWQAGLDLAATSIRQVDSDAPSQWRRQSWASDPDGNAVYIVPRPRCPMSLQRLGADGARGSGSSDRCLDRQRLAHVNGFSAGRDATLVSMATMDGTDIVFMAAPRD